MGNELTLAEVVGEYVHLERRSESRQPVKGIFHFHSGYLVPPATKTTPFNDNKETSSTSSPVPSAKLGIVFVMRLALVARNLMSGTRIELAASLHADANLARFHVT